jgi:tripartite-type tricarboxylate transporter receptor subunit TctC
MKLPRRNFLHLAAGAAALPAVSRIARAQAYPTRPVRWIVPYPPGGATDIPARLIGQYLSERLGQQFVIENRTGAGANIGTEAVVRSPPDGYTLLFISTANMINATYYTKLPFNFMRDIAPVAGLLRVPIVLVVNPSVPAKTVAEFIAYAKANPGKIGAASAGIGTSLHLSAELFKMLTGVELMHVPYRGRRSRADRPHFGSSSSHVRQPVHVAGAHQRRQAALAGRGDDRAIGDAARCADHRRDGAGL